ncbi:MAG: hypothetical protein EPN33_01195 [Acidobacteria bacterium]|nr:MAG: hypothetical protein EPN33_01195 [Acidobacteriota bacterium]
MKAKAKPVQYTIRGVPAEVDRILRRRAADRRQSLNQVIVNELTAATNGAKKYADFTDLVGKWVGDPEFDAIMADQRRIDWEMWR